MRTKQEVYDEVAKGELSIPTFKAMDAYAKEVAINYSHWVLKKMYPYMANGCVPDPEAQNLFERYQQETSSLK